MYSKPLSQPTQPPPLPVNLQSAIIKVQSAPSFCIPPLAAPLICNLHSAIFNLQSPHPAFVRGAFPFLATKEQRHSAHHLQEIPRARTAHKTRPRPFKIPAFFTAENDKFGRFVKTHFERGNSGNENNRPGNFQPITTRTIPASLPHATCVKIQKQETTPIYQPSKPCSIELFGH